MKRIGICAAVVLLSLGVWARTTIKAKAQVYEMTITVKTTVSQRGKITPVVCDTPTSEVNLYRKQSTMKLKGLFWGCDCDTIADPEKLSDATAVYGYIFWNETTKKVIDADFAWKVLNRIDKKLKKCEGAWMLENDELCLMGGGFGTVKDDVSKAACSINATIITPMSGNVAGWMGLPWIVVSKGDAGSCAKCESVEGTDDVVAFAPGWSICACDEGTEQTAVSGTWKLKYVAAAAKKWSAADVDASITTAYTFPSYVKSYIKSLGGEE